MNTVSKLLIILLLTISKGSFAADYTFKFGTVSADGEPLLEAMRQMSENIVSRSDGRIAIDVYGGGVLGTNKEVYEQIKNGAMVWTIGINPFRARPAAILIVLCSKIPMLYALSE